MARPTQATLDLDALRHNVALTKQLAPHSRLMAVIKANAYGHGMTVIGKALQPQVDALAVACIEEAVELRDAGITIPILLLEGVFEPAELALASQLQLWLTIANERQLDWLEQATLTQPVSCWLKIDTGMNRKGVPTDRAMACHQRLLECNQVRTDPVSFTHFAAADDLDAPLTKRQLQRFDQLPVSGPRSAANSAGTLAWPNSHYDWIRPGYMLYGHSPMLERHPAAQGLRPVMTLSSAVVAVRDLPAGESVGYGCTWVAERPSRIATVTIGYGDGYPRNAPNGTPVLINGQRAPLAGRVSMDMITVDVTDLEAVQAGDTVILWGQNLPLAEIAERADTIGYELTTRMPARTPRVIA